LHALFAASSAGSNDVTSLASPSSQKSLWYVTVAPMTPFSEQMQLPSFAEQSSVTPTFVALHCAVRTHDGAEPVRPAVGHESVIGRPLQADKHASKPTKPTRPTIVAEGRMRRLSYGKCGGAVKDAI
jgi:hypothetical protein